MIVWKYHRAVFAQPFLSDLVIS